MKTDFVSDFGDHNLKSDFAKTERFLKGSSMSAEVFQAIVLEPGLNDMKGQDVISRLEFVVDYLKAGEPEPYNYPLRVFYGFTKLTPKVMLKPAIAIYYENSRSTQNDQYINRRIHIVHVREQTSEEIGEGREFFKMWTKYEYMINHDWGGNIEGILFDNLMAEENHVSLEERELIRNLLRDGVRHFYGNKISNIYQSTFKF